MHRICITGLTVVVLALLPLDASSAQAPSRIDHIMIGTPDLAQGIDRLSSQLGVTPAAGGKHPAGTHNALLSLGPGNYLELIAPQPGVKETPFMAELRALSRPKPLEWAVSADDEAQLRARIVAAGFGLTKSEAGSRVTPAGTTLQWQTFELSPDVEGAPFFIVWSADSPHPSKTSPEGCTLESLMVTTRERAPLDRLVKALELPVRTDYAPKSRFRVTLKCPTGTTAFTNP